MSQVRPRASRSSTPTRRQTTQVWQWVKREPGKPAACREHTYHRNQPGEALIQKLQAIAFSLAEEENLTLVGRDASRPQGLRRRAGHQDASTTSSSKQHAAFLKFITGIPVKAGPRVVRLGDAQPADVRLLHPDEGLPRRRPRLSAQPARPVPSRSAARTSSTRSTATSLLRLFHEGFGRQRSATPELDKLLGRIPYLNGGLFDVHELERPDRYGKAIQIPDEAFEAIFDFFDRYQWHLDERPLRADNEINPDVLGYIFEKYINQKQMGAYYTKEDITEYISKNTIIPFLFDAARHQVQGRLRESQRLHGLATCCRTIPTATSTPPFATARGHSRFAARRSPPGVERPSRIPKRRKAGTSPRQPSSPCPPKSGAKSSPAASAARSCRTKLAGGRSPRHQRPHHPQPRHPPVRPGRDRELRRAGTAPRLLARHRAASPILDPTCGSGAFLFAALNILEPLYEACLDRMEAFVEDLDRSGEKHRPEKFTDFRKVLAQRRRAPQPPLLHPQVHHRQQPLRRGHHGRGGRNLQAAPLPQARRPGRAGRAEDNLGIEPLPDIDFNIRAGNTLVGYATADEVRRAFKEGPGGQAKLLLGDSSDAYQRFEEQVELADRAFDQFRELQTEHGMDARSL